MKKMDVQNYKLYQEVSAGGVAVLEKVGKAHVLVVEREKIRDCSLPKGHNLKDESLQETAVREVKEETGYNAKPIAYLGDFTYTVKSESSKSVTFRTVHWFLMTVEDGKPRRSNKEIKRVRVEPIEGDFSFLTYDNDRMFIKRAREVIKKLPFKFNNGS